MELSATEVNSRTVFCMHKLDMLTTIEDITSAPQMNPPPNPPGIHGEWLISMESPIRCKFERRELNPR